MKNIKILLNLNYTSRVFLESKQFYIKSLESFLFDNSKTYLSPWYLKNTILLNAQTKLNIPIFLSTNDDILNLNKIFLKINRFSIFFLQKKDNLFFKDFVSTFLLIFLLACEINIKDNWL